MQYEKIKFTMDWWTTYYDFGLKRQLTITPGSILVELKAQADARAATEKDAEKGATNDRNGSKKSKRSTAVTQRSALSDEDVKVRARATLDALGLKKRDEFRSERDQLDKDKSGVKRLRGGGDPVIDDPRLVSMQEQVGELQSMVLQLLDAKVQHEYL